MVTRDLRCPNCGHRCERFALGAVEPPHNCTYCDSIMVVEPSFPGGLQFKGSGWTTTMVGGSDDGTEPEGELDG